MSVQLNKDILQLEDVKLLVDNFYDKVRAHELLGPIFNGVIGDNWPKHLARMYTFWQTVLLGEHTYFGNPFPPHAPLPISEQHFEEWLALWHETIDTHFDGKKADEAKWRSVKMARMFLMRLEQYRGVNHQPLI